MDQDSFRQLLSTSATASSSSSRIYGSLLSKAATKPKTVKASEPAFKPRKVNKQSSYRDRASERRSGLDNDFAQVEAVLEDFEKRNKDNEDRLAIEEQRKYLGGDSDHSILVKGLDFALLEQNKAKAAAASAGVDDESLEQAFLEATSASAEAPPTIPKKRTRQDLIKELKEKRGSVTEEVKEKKDIGIEEAKNAGKFKPIGFKPVGKNETKKKDKQEKGREQKRKKRKVNPEDQTKPDESEHPLPGPPPPDEPQQIKEPKTVKEPEPEPDFDIFADAVEYAGLEIDDDDEEGSQNGAKSDHKSEPEPPSIPTRPRWFDEPKEVTPPPVPEQPLPTKEPVRDEVEEEQPTRLAPLASSAVPSIKDILAMDQAAEKEEKRKARKEKRKEKKELTAEGKASRDYQKLMAYEKKKQK